MTREEKIALSVLGVLIVGGGVAALIIHGRSAQAAPLPSGGADNVTPLPPGTSGPAPQGRPETPAAVGGDHGYATPDGKMAGTTEPPPTEGEEHAETHPPPPSGLHASERGLSPDRIVHYKTILRAIGAPDLSLDPTIDAQTRMAIRQFQGTYNRQNRTHHPPLQPLSVSVDGILGSKTQQALEHYSSLV